MKKLVEHGKKLVRMRVHARRGDLTDYMVAVAVGHKTGQKVALAVAETVEWPVEHPFAQGESVGKTTAQQRGVERLVRFAADHAHRDERGGVDVACAERASAAVGHEHGLPGSKGGKGGALRVYFVAEHPQVPDAQSSVLAL